MSQSIQIHLKEGKFHQLNDGGKPVGKLLWHLQRLTMGPLKLDESHRVRREQTLN